MGHTAPPCSRGWDGAHGVGHTETLTHLGGGRPTKASLHLTGRQLAVVSASRNLLYLGSSRANALIAGSNQP